MITALRGNLTNTDGTAIEHDSAKGYELWASTGAKPSSKAITWPFGICGNGDTSPFFST